VDVGSGSEDQLDEQEVARRRDEVLKRLLQTPPKRHEEMRVGKRQGAQRELSDRSVCERPENSAGKA
jgi:hypothetical protein